LTQQSIVWQSLILYQQGLRSFTVETVTQKILNEFMQDFEEAAGKEIFNSGAFKWTLGIIIGIILALIVLIGLGILIARPSASALMSIISSPPVIITAIVTTIGAVATPFINGFLGKLSKIGSFFGSAGTAVEQALENGYKQILIEFDYLNHNVGITFPLIEFFVWEEIKFGGNRIEDGYDFLVNVFWTAEDREEEIQQVARAAFGPLGAFVGGSLKQGNKGSQKTSPPSLSKNGRL
jgi:amino acid transporter